nr:unnamed protein product [Callosobruchus chinensis]
MKTETVKFPNLVETSDRDLDKAKRMALYTRHTPLEWTESNLKNYSEADINRNYSERLRWDFVKAMRQTDEKTSQGQRESDRRLGERITDITFWRNELRTELERLLTETSLLQDTRKNLLKAIEDINMPLHIVKECLYQREKREGIDLVHDHVEEGLLRELETFRNAQKKLQELHRNVENQLRQCRFSQHELESDIKSKESALGIDNVCHHLNNCSKGLNYYPGIEKYDNTLNMPREWADHSNKIIQKSHGERGKSTQLRLESENTIAACAQEVWNAWNDTNSALARRAGETLETKNRLQMHLHKVQQEIFDLEKHIELLKKAIWDKSNPTKVAQTRLEARTHRRGVELCKDTPHERLVTEVHDLHDSTETLERKLKEAQAQLQRLLKTRSNLESDLHVKGNSLFIDRDKCMGMRRSYPITTIIKY